jgi:hypothetical protein
MPDTTSPDPQPNPDTPKPPPIAPAIDPDADSVGPDDDEDDNPHVERVSKALTNRNIEMMLVELTKRRAIELLDTASDKGMANMSWYLSGVTRAQILVVRRWLEAIVVPLITDSILAAIDDAAGTKLAVAGGPVEDGPTKAKED